MKTKYLLLPLFMLTSCVLFQPKKTMNKYADGIDDIASGALDGIFRGLEDNQADSVVAQLTGAIVDAAINSSQKIDLDSVKIKLADVIRTAVRDGHL